MTEHTLPGGIDGLEIAIAADNRHHVVGNQPDAIAFARSFLDLRFQCRVQLAERLVLTGVRDRDAGAPAEFHRQFEVACGVTSGLVLREPEGDCTERRSPQTERYEHR